MTNYELLIKHFKINHETKVFFSRLSLTNGKPGIMYLHDTEHELQNFKNSFGYYLPIYVENEDNIETMNFDNDIDLALEYYSKVTWKDSKIIPHRETNVNGIYGELFLNIYMHIVLGINSLISYASKRSFYTNSETRGIDSIEYAYNSDKIELYLCEAKFVFDKNAAKSELLKDINGCKSNSESGMMISLAHLSKKYLDDYFSFVLKKDISCPNKEKIIIKKFFKEINLEINSRNNPKKFTDILIEKQIKVHFICFAIFCSSENSPDSLSPIYDELIEAINRQFKTIGISNFESEIVFVPTENSSVTIKKEIDSFYA